MFTYLIIDAYHSYIPKYAVYSRVDTYGNIWLQHMHLHIDLCTRAYHIVFVYLHMYPSIDT